jgi:phenylalanyl-tRNA synthetase alpha chain
MTPTTISPAAYRAALALPDLTDAAHGAHAMQTLVADVVQSLRRAWRCDAIVHRAHPLVSTADNYELLGYPPDAAARDARYTRYVTGSAVLRTHTSAMVPGLLRSLAAAGYEDVLLTCPGLVYRRDSIDRLHVGAPHQLDVWRVRAGTLTSADLHEMIACVAAAVLPGARYRTQPASHPYTEDGLEVEIESASRWVEILECGLASPAVLERAGLARSTTGLAMGIGLDRVLMLRKGIDDIRLLRSSDPRVSTQMLDLAPYRPVSSLPAMRRDLSIAVDPDATAEDLGDRVRTALGARAEAVETVAVVAETPVGELPASAVGRLGAAPGQKNVLLRVVLRHPTRTLTSAEANILRDDVYAAVHEGSVHAWAAR